LLTVKRRRLIGALAVLTVLSMSAAARASGPAPILAKAFRSSREGIGVRYPRHWGLTMGVKTVVTNPALCFALAPNGNSRVAVKLVEYLPPLLRPRDLPHYQPRPRHFRLTTLRRSDVDWTSGRVLSFRAHGRVFYVGVVRPAASSRSLVQTIQAILDSLQITSGRRCGLPTTVASATP
jgi:hypothetical protein